MPHTFQVGLPPGYDSYPAPKDSKRNIVETKECGNCSEEYYAHHRQFIPPQEMDHWKLYWCSPECFLAYAKNSLYPRLYTALEAAICSWENRLVVARPSRFLMKKNGGHIETTDYLGDSVRPAAEVGFKRIRLHLDEEDSSMQDAMQI
jgi:hypothetical protein